MLIQLLRPESITSAWQIIIMLFFLFVIGVLFFFLWRKIKKKSNNMNLFLGILLLSTVLGCTNEDSDERIEIDSLVNEFNLDVIDENSPNLFENALHFETIDDAREFLNYVGGDYTKIENYINDNPEFLEQNERLKKFITPDIASQQLIINDELTIKSFGHGFCQNYVTVMGITLNSLCISIFGDGFRNQYTAVSSLSGYTVGLGFDHIGSSQEYYQNNEFGFLITFQIHLYLIVEGLGRVYSFPPETHFGRYDFSARQGAIYQ